MSKNWREAPVQVLHAREIARRVWLALEQGVDKAFLIAFTRKPAPPRKTTLVAERRAGIGAKRLATCLAGTMGGPDLNEVWQRRQDFREARIHRVRARARGTANAE